MFNWLKRRVLEPWFWYHRQSQFSRKLNKCNDRISELDSSIDDIASEFAKARKAYQERTKVLDIKVANVRRERDKLKSMLDDMAEHVDTLESIVIPGLITANTTFAQSWDAQTAKHNFEKAAVNHRLDTSESD